MPIAFTCHACGHAISVAENLAGTTGPCPRCRAQVRVPPAFATPTPTPVSGTPLPPRAALAAQAPPTASAETALGGRFGHFLVQKELGRGGMGVVYRATDERLRRTVALKVLLDEAAESVKRFRREAEAVARLKHPNIVAVHDVG